MQLIVSQQGPLYSIQQALDQAQSGDTIFLRDSHYDEFFTISKNITLKGNDETVCTGGFKVEHPAVVLIENITFFNTPRIDCFGHTTFKRVHISNPQDPIALFAESCLLTLFHCQITTEDERDQGIQVKNGNARIESTLIKGAFNVGCFINHSEALLLATYFEHNFKGLQFERESTGEINECSFSHHRGTQCVIMSNSTVRIKNTRWQHGELHALSIIEQSDVHILHCEFTQHEDYQVYVKESTVALESCHLEKAQSGILLEQNCKARLLYVTCEQHENLQVKSIGPNDLYIAQCVFNNTNGNSLNVKEKGKAIVERTLFSNAHNPKYPQLYVEDSIIDLNECTFKRGASSALYSEQHSLLTIRNCEFMQHKFIQLHVRNSKLHLFNCSFTQCDETAVFYEQQSEGLVDGCHFDRSYNSQLAFNTNVYATVKNTSFTNAGTNAIYIQASNVTLEHIHIREHPAKYPAIFIDGSVVNLQHVSASKVNSHSIDIRERSTIVGSYISLSESVGAQMVIAHSKAQLSHLHFADGQSCGLQLQHSDVSISYSELRNHAVAGIYMEHGETTLHYTHVADHHKALEQRQGSLYAEGIQFINNHAQLHSEGAETFIKHSQFRTGNVGPSFIDSTVHFQNVSITDHDDIQLKIERCEAMLATTSITAGFGNGLVAIDCPIVQTRHTTIEQHDGESIVTVNTTITEE